MSMNQKINKKYMIDVTPPLRKNIIKNFELVSNIYSFVDREIERRRTYQLKKYLQAYTDRGLVFDVGIGYGGASGEAVKLGYPVHGVDISPTALQMSMIYLTYLLGGHYIAFLGDANICEFPRWHYDIVLCNQTLEHLEDDDAVLKKMFDALREGGVMILDVPIGGEVDDSPPKVTEHADGWVSESYGHRHVYNSLDDIINKVVSAGFVHIDSKIIKGAGHEDTFWEVGMIVADKVDR